MVLPTVKDADIPALFPNGIKTITVPSGKTYIRKTQQPEWKRLIIIVVFLFEIIISYNEFTILPKCF